MKRIVHVIALGCLLSFGAGFILASEIPADNTRKISKSKLFGSFAKALDKVAQAVANKPETPQEDAKQKIEAVAAVLDFVGVVAGDDGQQAAKTRFALSDEDPEVLECIMAVVRAGVALHMPDFIQILKSSIQTTQDALAHDTLLRGGTQTTVAVQSDPKATTQTLIMLFTLLWKLVQEVSTQQNVSDFLTQQISGLINYFFGNIAPQVGQIEIVEDDNAAVPAGTVQQSKA